MESVIAALEFRELGVFNSREVAIFICVVLPLAYSLRSKEIRKRLFKIIKIAFEKKFVILYTLMILYSLIPIYIYYKLGLWQISLFKDGIFWLLFSALPLMFTVQDAKKDFFINSLKDNAKVTIITDFIISQHTFNVFVEMIIVAFTVFSGMLVAYSEKEEKNRDVNRLFKTLLYILGFSILVSSIYHFICNVSKFTTLDKFEEFSLPIVLGVWFIPFLYFLHLYMTYESVFSSLEYSIEDEGIRKYAKRKSVINFNFNTSSLRRWRDSLFIDKINTKEDVLISFLDVKRLELIERNPPKIDISQGWSPYESKDFLVQSGIPTNNYKRCYENEWQAVSSYIKLNDEINDNNIAYYVSGDNAVAKQLKLVLNINSFVEEDFAINTFAECANTLYKAAFNATIPSVLTHAILKRRNELTKLLNKEISISKTEHYNNNKAYTLVFIIKNEYLQ